jgi:glycerol-3-phosphate acyltransferase PlsY
LAAIVASLSAPIISYFLHDSLFISIMYLLISALIIFRHHSNIKNLIAGVEPSFKK